MNVAICEGVSTGAIRTEYPDWNADQVNREIAKRISLGVVNDDPRVRIIGKHKP